MSLAVALRLGRVSNLPTVWSNVLTGAVLAGSAATPATVIACLLAMSLLYTAGMFLNDAFDRDIDARQRPQRPIPSGQVSAQSVFGWGFALMALALIVLLAAGYALAGGHGWRAAAGGAALGAAIVLYDWHHKNNPLSPLLMGLCRLLVYVTAGVAVAGSVAAPLAAAGAMLLCYLIGLTYAAKQEGFARVRSWWPLALLAVPALYTLPDAHSSLTALACYAAFVAWTLFAVSHLMRTPANVPRAVVCLIAGICLLDAVLIAAQGQSTLAWLATFGFALTLALQRWVKGT
jgi:4-hydroxybenzoate polyprenyltransferase